MNAVRDQADTDCYGAPWDTFYWLGGSAEGSAQGGVTRFFPA